MVRSPGPPRSPSALPVVSLFLVRSTLGHGSGELRPTSVSRRLFRVLLDVSCRNRTRSHPSRRLGERHEERPSLQRHLHASYLVEQRHGTRSRIGRSQLGSVEMTVRSSRRPAEAVEPPLRLTDIAYLKTQSLQINIWIQTQRPTIGPSGVGGTFSPASAGLICGEHTNVKSVAIAGPARLPAPERSGP